MTVDVMGGYREDGGLSDGQLVPGDASISSRVLTGYDIFFSNNRLSSVEKCMMLDQTERYFFLSFPRFFISVGKFYGKSYDYLFGTLSKRAISWFV